MGEEKTQIRKSKIFFFVLFITKKSIPNFNQWHKRVDREQWMANLLFVSYILCLIYIN